MYSKGKKLFTSLFIICFVLVQVIFTGTAFAQTSADNKESLKTARGSVEALEGLAYGEISTYEDMVKALVALESASLSVNDLEESVKARWQERFTEARGALRIEQQKMQLRDSRLVALMRDIDEEIAKMQRFYILPWWNQYGAAFWSEAIDIAKNRGIEITPEMIGAVNQQLAENNREVLDISEGEGDRFLQFFAELSINPDVTEVGPEEYILVSVINSKPFLDGAELDNSIDKIPVGVEVLPILDRGSLDNITQNLSVQDGKVFLANNNVYYNGGVSRSDLVDWELYEDTYPYDFGYINEVDLPHGEIVYIQVSKGDATREVPVLVLVQGNLNDPRNGGGPDVLR